MAIPRPWFELWCQRNTQTESACLRRLVTGDAPFFSLACHLGLDARFGVQDVRNLGEPPAESPAPAPPAAGFFVAGGPTELGNLSKGSAVTWKPNPDLVCGPLSDGQ